MKFFLAALAMAVAGAGAQSTVSAPCGTACPTTVSDKMITRSKAMPTETAPCPSLIVSSISGGSNNTNPMLGAMPSPTPTSPTAFTGGADRLGGSMGVAVAAVAAVLAL